MSLDFQIKNKLTFEQLIDIKYSHKELGAPSVKKLKKVEQQKNLCCLATHVRKKLLAAKKPKDQ
jgi:hypothetical protein